jgi:ABC-type amino acid transport substrate-binding protein
VEVEEVTLVRQKCPLLFFMLLIWVTVPRPCSADLREVLASGVLRHLGVVHARFVTENSDGLDIELIQLFSRHLGVSYRYVESSWDRCILDLTGCEPIRNSDGGEICSDASTSVLGDVVAHGMMVLPTHRDRVLLSDPVFPTQIWIMAGKDSAIRPITPTGDIQKDIAAVKSALQGHTVLSKTGGCLDPSLYGLQGCDVKAAHVQASPQDMVRAMLKSEAEAMLMEVPDALLALERYPQKLKVIGPISSPQVISCAFSRNSPELLQAFNVFLEECRRDGTLYRLAHRYFPSVLHYFPGFPWFLRVSSLFSHHGDCECCRAAV